MLKIGFDAKRLFNNFTGLGNYSRDLVHNLGEFYPENEYHLYTPKLKVNPRTQSFLFNPIFKVHQPTFPLFKYYWRSFGMKKRFKKDGIQIYHGLSHELPFGIRGANVRSVVTMHDLVFKYYPNFFPWVDRQIYDLKFRYACEHSDLIIAISESTKKDIIQEYAIPESKIKVVYQTCHSVFQENQSSVDVNFVDKNDLTRTLGFELPSDYLLYVGSIIERKNLLGCVKAIEQLPEDIKIPLLVVGEGKSYKKEVQKYIRSKAIEKWVIFCPKVNMLELKYLYQNAKILLYPSFYEGFGLPIIESLFSKTPVITSNISSLPEAGGGGALYVNPSEVEEIKESIIKLLVEEKYRNRIVKIGFEHVQKFKSKKVTEDLIKVYRELISKH
jgi:glycosyltransferase involved in cell wall biosynthesis